MKEFKIFGLLLALGFGILACDEISDPFPEGLGDSIIIDREDSLILDSLGIDSTVEVIVDPTLNVQTSSQLVDLLIDNDWPDTNSGADNSNMRFIVLEEFTGHKCFNCPIGTKEVVRLNTQLDSQLIPVAIHAGNFAEPQPSGDKFRTDHRVEGGHGEDYAQEFNPGNEFPRGMVNRNGGIVSTVASWQGDINAIINDNPLASLQIVNYYSPGSNLLRIDVTIEWLSTLPEDYNLQLLLTEDNVQDWQDSLGRDVQFYNHRFNLRKVVNDTWGKRLEAANQGETERIQYILPLNTAWKAIDLKSIAFIYNVDPSSYEIIQANTSSIE